MAGCLFWTTRVFGESGGKPEKSPLRKGSGKGQAAAAVTIFLLKGAFFVRFQRDLPELAGFVTVPGGAVGRIQQGDDVRIDVADGV